MPMSDNAIQEVTKSTPYKMLVAGKLAFLQFAATVHYMIIALANAIIMQGPFGGIPGSAILPVAIDLLRSDLCGRVARVIRAAFASGQISGLPAGLCLSNRWAWQRKSHADD